MIEGRFRAMGTEVVVIAASPDVVADAQVLFDQMEQRFSRFLPDSELRRVNETPAPSVELSPELAEVLQTAGDLRARTDGLVDPGVGAALVAWGYDRDFDQVSDRGARPTPLPRDSWMIEGRTLHRRPGLLIDLGGIAKGWTCDRVVTQTGAAMCNAGGDLRSTDPGLSVIVEGPWGDDVAEVHVGIGALATSTVAHRAWRVGGEWVSHLIDPRAMEPVKSPVVSASALAGTAVEAEAAAKAILLLGPAGLAWASRQSWVRGGLAQWADGRVFATTGWEVAA